MAKAIWNDQVIAQSDDTIMVEGNHYFLPDSVRREFLKQSGSHTSCHWKGQASYYTLEVDGRRNEDAAWFYPNPSDAATNIKDYVAFWRGVQVESERRSLLGSVLAGLKGSN